MNWCSHMQANPDKFQVLAVGKKTFDKNMKICIQNSTLSCEETVIQSEVLFPALSLIFLNCYRYKNAKPKGRS
jgi:hypothetical protein